jgi:hypothetical protein
MVDLGDGVLGSASRPEPVTTRAEVRFEDRLEDQLQAGLHSSVPGGRYPETTELARRLGDHPFPHGPRLEPPGLEIVSQPGQQRVDSKDDGVRFHSVDPGRACPPISPYPIPRHQQERRIGDKVEQVNKPTVTTVGRPLVQLGLDSQYPRLGLFERRPKRAGIHRRPPGIPGP